MALTYSRKSRGRPGPKLLSLKRVCLVLRKPFHLTQHPGQRLMIKVVRKLQLNWAKPQKAAREEKQRSHKSTAIPEPVITTSTSPEPTITAAKKGSSSQPAIANEKAGGVLLTRFRAEDKASVIEENESIYAGLPRGYKSLASTEALQRALNERLKALRVSPRSCVATATNFVWIRF